MVLQFLAISASGYLVPPNPLPAAAHRPLRILGRSCTPVLQEQTKQKAPFGLSGLFQQDVPEDQQPVNELRELRGKPFYDWCLDDGYGDKLGNLYKVIMLLFALPISYTTYNQLPFELPQLLIAANIGTLGVMLPFVFRLRVGWGFISERLKEQSTYFESKQRGLFASKDRETSVRDRLLERQEVAPALRRADVSLAAISAGLVLSLVAGEAVTALEGENGPATLKTLQGDEAIAFTNRLRGDDEFARREQARAQRKANADGTGLKPAYCDSRYYKILAGGNGQGGVGCD